MCVLQVGQSAQYGLWSKEVMIEVHDNSSSLPTIGFFDFGTESYTIHEFVLGFILHVQLNEKLFSWCTFDSKNISLPLDATWSFKNPLFVSCCVPTLKHVYVCVGSFLSSPAYFTKPVLISLLL